jgi:hypothetical protein
MEKNNIPLREAKRPLATLSGVFSSPKLMIIIFDEVRSLSFKINFE